MDTLLCYLFLFNKVAIYFAHFKKLIFALKNINVSLFNKLNYIK